MTVPDEGMTWPVERAPEAIAALARRCGLPLRPVDPPSAPPGRVLEDSRALSDWMERAADWLGIEAECVTAAYFERERLLRGAGPALMQVPRKGTLRLVALLDGRGTIVRVLCPDHTVKTLAASDVLEWVDQLEEQRAQIGVDGILSAVGVSPRQRARAREAILGQALALRPAVRGWILRLPPGASFRAQVRFSRLWRPLTLLLIAHLGQVALGILSWWMLGRGALEGRLDPGWLSAWALLLVSQVPLRALENWQQSRLAIDGGALLKRRLLAGAVALPLDDIRREGVGQLLGRVLESQAVESLAMGAGLSAFVAVLELVAAGGVLLAGASGWMMSLLLIVWIGVALLLSWRYLRLRDPWTTERLGMTHDLVERIVGHRTRLAQQVPERWHEGEDESLDRYLELSNRMDRASVWLQALLGRGWLLLAILGLVRALVLSSEPPTAIAIALGGVLLAQQALRRLVQGLASLGGAAIAWRMVRPLFGAAERVDPPSPPDVLTLTYQRGRRDPDRTVLDARDVVFRYRKEGEPTLHGCSMRISAFDRLLLEGGSGGGKSTLGAVLSGLRAPESGLLLLDGLDRKTIGSVAWHRRIVAVPQFHENHLLSATLDFNLLMGRGWPGSPEEIAEAEEICRELDLGPLLDRMPAGLLQRVGGSGWQLSHGERSRVFIARALMQRAELVILDESFAALDPETLERAMECVLKRADALLVIAHP